MRDPVLVDEFYLQRELDAERAEEDQNEREEEETLEDRESRARLALLYAEAHLTTVPALPFREWAREQIRREVYPEHTKAWIEYLREETEGRRDHE
jgi:hypothetical protein